MVADHVAGAALHPDLTPHTVAEEHFDGHSVVCHDEAIIWGFQAEGPGEGTRKGAVAVVALQEAGT